MPPLIRPDYHGTATNYGYGCRCNDCRSAWRTWARYYRSVKRPTTVITYAAGAPVVRPAVVIEGTRTAQARSIQITQQGHEYLTALRAEGAPVAP